METIKVELRNKGVLALLRSLEKVKLIRLLPVDPQNNKSLQQLKGSISRERAKEMVKEIEKSRSEWEERSI